MVELGGYGVTSVEYLEVARALTRGTDSHQAITYFQDAVSALPHDVGIEAEALRLEGDFYYTLGQPATGHRYVIRSIQTLSAELLMSQFIKSNEIAQAYLDDASNQLSIRSCTTAHTDIVDARKMIFQAGGENPTNRSSLPSVENAYSTDCLRR